MREYELLYIISGDKTEEEAAKATDAVNESIQKAGGKVESQDDWGRRRLAYEIGSQDHGWYVVCRFSIESAKLDDAQKALNIAPDVIRTVIVKASEIPTAEEAERTLQAVESEEKAAKEQAEEEKTVKKVAPKPTAKKETVPAEEKPKKAETAEDKAKRAAKLEESLGEILKED